MNDKILLRTLALCCCLLASCGGGSDNNTAEVDRLRDLANAKEAEARVLALDTSCASDDQCVPLRFGVTAHSCNPDIYAPLSLANVNASRAQDAAQEQRALATLVVALLPPSDIACPAVVIAPPTYACVANRCQQNP